MLEAKHRARISDLKLRFREPEFEAQTIFDKLEQRKVAYGKIDAVPYWGFEEESG